MLLNINNKINITLCGMMGSGKSAIGKILANKLDYNFIDVDKIIEKEAKKTIKKIFEDDGEEYFRDLEEKINQELIYHLKKRVKNLLKKQLKKGGRKVTILTARRLKAPINHFFKTISVSGQTDIAADQSDDTLTLVGAGGASIATDANTDTITITTANDNTTYTAGSGLDLSTTEFSIETSQTTIESLRNNSLVVGGNTQNNYIDFGSDDMMLFNIDDAEKMRVDSAGVDITGNLTVLGGTSTYINTTDDAPTIQLGNDNYTGTSGGVFIYGAEGKIIANQRVFLKSESSSYGASIELGGNSGEGFITIDSDNGIKIKANGIDVIR